MFRESYRSLMPHRSFPLRTRTSPPLTTASASHLDGHVPHILAYRFHSHQARKCSPRAGQRSREVPGGDKRVLGGCTCCAGESLFDVVGGPKIGTCGFWHPYAGRRAVYKISTVEKTKKAQKNESTI